MRNILVSESLNGIAAPAASRIAQMKDESSSMLVSPAIPFPSRNPLASRALSAFEFCFGAFIVIGHNVFHIVPNEVIVLSVLGLFQSGCATATGLRWD